MRLTKAIVLLALSAVLAGHAGATAASPFEVRDLIAFDPANKIRKRVFVTDKLEMELVCYSPGHATVEHHHVGVTGERLFLDLAERSADPSLSR